MKLQDFLAHCITGQAIVVDDTSREVCSGLCRVQDLQKPAWAHLLCKRICKVYATSFDNDGKMEGIINVIVQS